VRLRSIAERATDIGAAVVASAGAGSRPAARQKGAGDWVTSVDRTSEEAIRRFLSGATPDISMIGEEEGGRRGDRYWAVDPLDGTTNFLLGFPVVGVSVALIEDGRPVAGAVRAPFLDLSFSAARSLGAWSRGRRLAVSDRPARTAVVAMAYPFRRKSLVGRYQHALDRVLASVEDVRRAGAASLDLAWVAAGVFDGYFELNLSEWDLAAGALLVEEAGGVVTDWEGGPHYLRGDVLAGSPTTHRVLLDAAGTG